jgi:hypothetical protein
MNRRFGGPCRCFVFGLVKYAPLACGTRAALDLPIRGPQSALAHPSGEYRRAKLTTSGYEVRAIVCAIGVPTYPWRPAQAPLHVQR